MDSDKEQVQVDNRPLTIPTWDKYFPKNLTKLGRTDIGSAQIEKSFLRGGLEQIRTDKGKLISSDDTGSVILGDPRTSVQQSGTVIATRKRLNVIAGTNVTILTADNPSNDRVDVTISSSGGGGGVGSTPVDNEVPGGLVNSSNTVYTTAFAYITGTTAVYLNGQRQKLSTDYTESSASHITFSIAPTTGDTITIDYFK